MKRGEYDEEVVRWADAILSAGGRNFTLFGHLGFQCLNSFIAGMSGSVHVGCYGHCHKYLFE